MNSQSADKSTKPKSYMYHYSAADVEQRAMELSEVTWCAATATVHTFHQLLKHTFIPK